MLDRVCIEVACRNAAFSDGYGNSIDRSSACYNSAQSLVLRVTDNCPCHYPNNAYSNSRWCACAPARPATSSRKAPHSLMHASRASDAEDAQCASCKHDRVRIPRD